MNTYSRYFVVTYTGIFGYLKPFSALRDGQTHSQQFLTPSVLQGIAQKLGIAGPIIGHKVRYAAMVETQETTRPKVRPKLKKELEIGNKLELNTGILNRLVLLYPQVRLAFSSEEDANLAASQHICFCRNEDILYPAFNENKEESESVLRLSPEEWAKLPGFELVDFSTAPKENSFLVGFNRFDNFSPMYGKLTIEGVPILSAEEI
jgi:hypothetical protein